MDNKFLIHNQLHCPAECDTIKTKLFGTNRGFVGTVLGHAIARPCWGKSECEQSVASQSPEDFTAHPEKQPLKQNPCQSQYGAMQTNLRAIYQQEHVLRQ
jgi:hypothetical protein